MSYSDEARIAFVAVSSGRWHPICWPRIPTSMARKKQEEKVKASAQRNRQRSFDRSKLRHGDKIKHGVYWSKAPIAAAVKSRSHVCPGLDPFGSKQCGRALGLTRFTFVSSLLHRFVSSLISSYLFTGGYFLNNAAGATIARATKHTREQPDSHIRLFR